MAYRGMLDAGGGGICLGRLGAFTGSRVVRNDVGGDWAVEHDGAVLDVDDEYVKRDCGGRSCGDFADGGWGWWICRALHDGTIAGCHAQLYGRALLDQRHGAWRCGVGAGGEKESK